MFILKLLLITILFLISFSIIELNLVDAPGRPGGGMHEPARIDTHTFRDDVIFRGDDVKIENPRPPTEDPYATEYNGERELGAKDKDMLGIPKIYNVIVKKMTDPIFGMSKQDKGIIDFLNTNGGLEFIKNKDKKDLSLDIITEFNKNYDTLLNDHIIEIMNLRLIVYFNYIKE